jgi:hypothetical protein
VRHLQIVFMARFCIFFLIQNRELQCASALGVAVNINFALTQNAGRKAYKPSQIVPKLRNRRMLHNGRRYGQ